MLGRNTFQFLKKAAEKKPDSDTVVFTVSAIGASLSMANQMWSKVNPSTEAKKSQSSLPHILNSELRMRKR